MPSTTQQAVLDRIEPVADGVVALTLRGAPTPWEPGAHIDVSLPNWLTRQYSLCGDPADSETLRIAVRHERLSRGGSDYIHRYLRPGRKLPISPPRNNFPLVGAESYLFIAGGIGITAVLPMLRHAVASGVPARLVYTGRSRATMPFTDEIRELCGDAATLVETERDARPDLPALAAALPPGGAVYCCGPAAMLTAAEAAFDPAVLHTERFRPARRTFAPNTPFTAVCARSGGSVEVPADTSLLDALTHAGHRVASGCREGVCGSCVLKVLGGEPEHRDDIGAAQGEIYTCVSRSRTPRLVLDL
ncbi:PDR/VanB family oxidoreductase [Streptomyces sp. 8L]|uniref:PDR/VanB family oxidoreductase n=1 Tax=Streptomyces sp. 8L TaxID=2877242 RepID=UPI001CD5C730|nr:PDR/VanB family oxidoreductase [Streptomyces sp. 8L]MCA1220228.1 PDR/VanB family oxidoreductase [Streptomyces sp. 8L]